MLPSNDAPSFESVGLAKSINRMCLLFGCLLGMVVHFSDLPPILFALKNLNNDHDLAKHPEIHQFVLVWSTAVLALTAGAFLLFDWLVRKVVEAQFASSPRGASIPQKSNLVDWADGCLVAGAVVGYSVAPACSFGALDLLWCNFAWAYCVKTASFLALAVLLLLQCSFSQEDPQENEGVVDNQIDIGYVRML